MCSTISSSRPCSRSCSRPDAPDAVWWHRLALQPLLAGPRLMRMLLLLLIAEELARLQQAFRPDAAGLAVQGAQQHARARAVRCCVLPPAAKLLSCTAAAAAADHMLPLPSVRPASQAQAWVLLLQRWA